MTNKQSTDVAVVNEARVAALRDVSGAQESAEAVWPNKLRVNRKPFAEDESTLPMGKFVVSVNNVDHYLNEVDFIAMEKRTQFLRFSKEGYVGCTMLENSYNPEYRDSLGGTRLGRVVGLDYDDWTDAQKEVKFYFHMLGVADVSQAVDVQDNRIYEGNEAVFVPVALQFRGRKSVDKQKEFQKLKKRGEAYFDFVTHLEKPFKDGDIDGVPYYDFNFVRGDQVELTSQVVDSIEATKLLIENENKRIYKKYLEAQAVGDNTEEASYTDLDLVDED